MERPRFARLVIQRLRSTLIVSTITLVGASIGYVVIAGFDPFDALYMTVITLGTIGYNEVHPLDTAGRVWTIVVIGAGFASLLYAASTLSSVFLSGEASRLLKQRRGFLMRDRLDGHVIVVGFGRVGRSVAAAVAREGLPCLVVDLDPDAAVAGEAAGYVVLTGDATDEGVLREARIERARAVVAAGPEDATNLVVVLTARSLRSDLRIVSRVNNAAWQERIRRAGADLVLSPYDSFGSSLAASALHAPILGLQDLPTLGLRTEEIVVPPASAMVDRPVVDLTNGLPGVLLLGLRRDGKVSQWHSIEGNVRPGDVVVALGPPGEIGRLAARIGGV